MKKCIKRLTSMMLAAVFAAACLPAVQNGRVSEPRLHLEQKVWAADTVGLTGAAGWFESGSVEWKPDSTDGIASYAVYCDGNKIDDELIRCYSDGHWRADIVGVTAGAHSVKIEGVDSTGVVKAQQETSFTALANDRTGFTFSPDSRYDKDSAACGGYNADGTPKDGAEIIYVTSAEDITNVKSADGTVGLSNILQSRDKRTTKPLIVRIIGKIQYSGDQLNSAGYIQVKPSKAYTNYNTTIEGIGPDTTLNFGFLLRNAGNVEIRNLAIHDFADDGISLDTDNTDVWIHNCDIFYGKQGGGDKAKGDGSTDVKGDSQFVTLSYNHYWDAGKCSLCGMKSESGDNFITYHHNWFDHSDSRHPRIRTMSVHVYNNYFDGNAKYGVGCSADSNAFVEGNYFRNCKYPSLQGSVGCDSDGKGGSNTFDDSPATGTVKLWNNTIIGANAKWTTDSAATSAGNGDAYNASARNEVLDYTTAAGSKYNNFDTNNAYVQSLSVQSPEDAKTNVELYAGRTGGKDFASASGFAFNNSVDDVDYEINTTLRAAVTSYYTDAVSSQYKIKSIGGSVDGSFVPVPTETTSETTTEVTTETASQETSKTTPIEQEAPAAGTTPEGTAASGGVNEVIYREATDDYLIHDTSSTTSTTWTVPFKAQSTGVVIISGKAAPTKASGSWDFVQIRGKSAGKDAEIVSLATDSKKNLSMRIAGGTEYISLGEAIAVTSYDYKFVIDMDAQTAALTVNGKTVEGKISAEEISRVFMQTAVSDTTRDIVATLPKIEKLDDEAAVDGVWGDWDGDKEITASDATFILQYVLTPDKMDHTEEQVNRCKVLGDASITASDAAAVLQKTLDGNVKFPVEK